MQEKDKFPIYNVPGINNGQGWTFYSASGEVNVSNQAQEIKTILEHSNGHNSLEGIQKQSQDEGHAPELIKKVIDDLLALRILVDSREQYKDFHEITNNPALYNWGHTLRDIVDISLEDSFNPRIGQIIKSDIQETLISELAEQRESCRSFVKEPLSSSLIATCLDAAYSAEKRPVPSAGGLYPLRMYAIIKESGSDIPPGFYQYDHNDQTLIKFKDDVDWDRLGFVFNSEDTLHDAPVIFVIAADLNRQPSKYSNRGYRYTLLEAGHAAQNIHMVAQELGLGSLEYGGFNDENLARELEMPQGEVTIITVALGHKRTEYKENINNTLLKLEDYLGSDKSIEWARVDTSSNAAKALDFYHAIAKYKSPNSIYPEGTVLNTSGTAKSIDLARIKAIAEARERYSAGRYKYDVFAAAEDLGEEWISPDTIKPLTSSQYENQNHLDKFDPKKPIQWIKGTKANGNSVLVPVDLVFYPLSKDLLKRKRIVDADSSGMAAHTDYRESVNRAILELVERDATMRLWFNKEAPKRISTDVLPTHFKNRTDVWAGRNRAVEILDVSHDGIAIINVIIRSLNGQYPYMVSGAAASSESFEVALSKAYQEAELGFTNAMFSDKKVERIEPENVVSPEDHGRLYYYDDQKAEVEWLWSGEHSKIIPEIDHDLDLATKYDPVTVRLTDESELLQVVRVLSHKLVPINFGYGNEHYSHHTLNMNNNRTNTPHFFA